MDLLVWAAKTSVLTPNLGVYGTHHPSSRGSQTQLALHFSMYSRSAVLASCMESCVPSCRWVGSWQVGAETPGKLSMVRLLGCFQFLYRVGAYIPGGVFHQHWGVYVSFRECIYGKRIPKIFFSVGLSSQRLFKRSSSSSKKDPPSCKNGVNDFPPGSFPTTSPGSSLGANNQPDAAVKESSANPVVVRVGTRRCRGSAHEDVRAAEPWLHR